MAEDDTLSVKEVAAYLHLDPSTVRRKRAAGELIAHEVHTKHGMAWRFPEHLLPAPPGAPLDAPPAELVVAPVGAPLGEVAPPALVTHKLTTEATSVALLVDRLEAQARDIGRLEAERDAALAREAELRAMLESPKHVPWWRRLFGRE